MRILAVEIDIMKNTRKDLLQQSIDFIATNPLAMSNEVPLHLLESWLDMEEHGIKTDKTLAMSVFMYVVAKNKQKEDAEVEFTIDEDDFISLYNAWQHALQFTYLDRLTEYKIKPLSLFNISIYDDLNIHLDIIKVENLKN